MSNIRVAIVDDQTLIREGLASLLALVPDLTVVGKAADGREALALVSEYIRLPIKRELDNPRHKVIIESSGIGANDEWCRFAV
jgi:CheY-like chemotaxis protein